MQKILVTICSLVCVLITNAQKADSSRILKEITVTGYKTVNGVGHLPEIKNGIIYAGVHNADPSAGIRHDNILWKNEFYIWQS